MTRKDKHDLLDMLESLRKKERERTRKHILNNPQDRQERERCQSCYNLALADVWSEIFGMTTTE